LDQLLARLPRVDHPDLLVGFETSDDAGVYRLTPDLAIVQTIDFFTPIVDDPSTFGAIAAANALSDIYAMGGRPVTALSVLAWPGSQDQEELEQVVQAGAAKILEAGCLLIGGHSVNDPEIKFGYAVTGTIHPDRIRRNSGARPGDVLLLTKPIGTGIIATALKQEIAREEHVRASIDSMLRLNRDAAEAMEDLDVHAVTDVTGFGLLGHAREIAVASGVSIEINAAAVPLFPGAVEYARAGALAGGLKNNREFVESCVESLSDLDDLLYDPQTSGGLLISLPPSEAGKLKHRLAIAAEIGTVIERIGKLLYVL
jgi:selenide,water dikinase